MLHIGAWLDAGFRWSTAGAQLTREHIPQQDPPSVVAEPQAMSSPVSPLQFTPSEWLDSLNPRNWFGRPRATSDPLSLRQVASPICGATPFPLYDYLSADTKEMFFST
jgi:hypothetical protein